MNALARYRFARDNGSGNLDTLQGAMPPDRTYGGGMGSFGGRGDETLINFNGSPNALAPPPPHAAPPQQQQQGQPPGADGILHQLMTRARSREEAEQMLQQMVQQGLGDGGYEAVDQVARHLQLRAPWHRDFRGPPARQPGANMGPSGRPMPFERE